jgi:hypothetical protein
VYLVGDMMTADTPLIKDTNDWYKPIPLLVTKFNSICWMKSGMIMFFKNHNGRWAHGHEFACYLVLES